jgi:hypothetical protein
VSGWIPIWINERGRGIYTHCLAESVCSSSDISCSRLSGLRPMLQSSQLLYILARFCIPWSFNNLTLGKTYEPWVSCVVNPLFVFLFCGDVVVRFGFIWGEAFGSWAQVRKGGVELTAIHALTASA